jgi:hypothetical protein
LGPISCCGRPTPGDWRRPKKLCGYLSGLKASRPLRQGAPEEFYEKPNHSGAAAVGVGCGARALHLRFEMRPARPRDARARAMALRHARSRGPHNASRDAADDASERCGEVCARRLMPALYHSRMRSQTLQADPNEPVCAALSYCFGRKIKKARGRCPAPLED